MTHPSWSTMAPISSSRSRVLDLLSSRRKFFSLPQPFYTEREVFDLDLEAIFYRRWIFAGADLHTHVGGMSSEFKPVLFQIPSGQRSHELPLL